MPEPRRCRLIARPPEMAPDADYEKVNLKVDLELVWGEKELPRGAVCLLDLGYRSGFDAPLDASKLPALAGEPPRPKPAPPPAETPETAPPDLGTVDPERVSRCGRVFAHKGARMGHERGCDDCQMAESPAAG